MLAASIIALGSSFHSLTDLGESYIYIYVVVNFLSKVIFIFILFLGMLMYANEV